MWEFYPAQGFRRKGGFGIQILIAFMLCTGALRAQNCAPAPLGLVGWWKGEEGTADAVGSNNGALIGNTSFAPGIVGQAFSFDGYNDSVMIGNPAALQLQDFTIEAWIKRASPNQASLDIFTVGVAGTSPFSYTWRRNGVLISGAAGPTLVINNVQTTNAGTYIVRVSNALGGINSAPATLTVASGQFSPLIVSSNGVQLTGQGEAGATYVIESSSDLVHWDPLVTLLNNPQNWQFTDTTAIGVSQRFYRLQKSP